MIIHSDLFIYQTHLAIFRVTKANEEHISIRCLSVMFMRSFIILTRSSLVFRKDSFPRRNIIILF